jgi:hypothetical protein
MIAPNPLKGNPLQRLDMARFHCLFDETMLMHIMETFWDYSPTEPLPQ